jgi:hypothetical protein
VFSIVSRTASHWQEPHDCGLSMDIDIIPDPEYTPQQIVEISVKAEKLGIRAVWSSNYHQHWDSFVSTEDHDGEPGELPHSRLDQERED